MNNMEESPAVLENESGPNGMAVPADEGLRAAEVGDSCERGASAASKRWAWRDWGICGVLVVILLGQIWLAIGKLSVTCDEKDHLHAGYRYLQCNDFGWNPEHPPLVKEIAAVPLLFMHPVDPIAAACGLPNSKVIDFGLAHMFMLANGERILNRGRISVSIFAAVLLFVTFAFARRLFGTAVAAIAGVLIAFEPNVLANGGLITTDVAATLGYVLSVFALWLYLRDPNWKRVLLLGLAIGIAFASKHSTALLVVILPAVIVVDGLFTERTERLQKIIWNLSMFCCAVALGLLVLWGTYGFRYLPRPNGRLAWQTERLKEAKGKLPTEVIPALESARILPQAYLTGLQDIAVESELGRNTFLLGRNHEGGLWYYFLVASSIKLTVGFLALTAFAVFARRFWRAHLQEFFVLALPVAIFLAQISSSGLNIGMRHALPMVPFLAVIAAASAWQVAKTKRVLLGAVIALLALHAASSIHAFPNYLCYGNELWGGPGETYKYLGHSNTDWGQAQKMARDYIAEHKPASCFFIRNFDSQRSEYGIPCGSVSVLENDIVPRPFTGTLIVGANVVDGTEMYPGGTRVQQLFKGMTPKAKLGGSALLVYEGTFDLGPLVAVQHLWRVGRVARTSPEVIEEAKLAAAADPGFPIPHYLMCQAYLDTRDRQSAAEQCNEAIRLLKAENAETRDRHVQKVMQLMDDAGLPISASN